MIDIEIKPFEENLINDKYMRWMCDSEICLYIDSAKLNYSLKELDKYVTYLLNDKNNYLYGIFLNNSHVGNFRIGTIHNDKAKFGILIGEKHLWGNGIGTYVINWGLQKSFENFKLNKVWVNVLNFNFRALNLFTGCGFKFVCQKGTRKIFEFTRNDYGNNGIGEKDS